MTLHVEQNGDSVSLFVDVVIRELEPVKIVTLVVV